MVVRYLSSPNPPATYESYYAYTYARLLDSGKMHLDRVGTDNPHTRVQNVFKK